MNKIETALISVSKKDEIANFASLLKDFDIEILSTGGTSRLLKDAHIEVTEISEYIQSPEGLKLFIPRYMPAFSPREMMKSILKKPGNMVLSELILL